MEPKEIKNLLDSLLNLQVVAKQDNQTSIAENTESLLEQLKLVFVEKAIVEVITEYFNFGKVTSVSRLFGGLINQNYSVTTNSGYRKYRLFIKRYNPEATNKEIVLEHKFNEYLCKEDFPEIAECIKSNDGHSFIEHHVDFIDPPERTSRFAVYTYLDGEDRYAWQTPHCTEADLASASIMLAKIHERGFGFEGKEFAKEEPKIIDWMKELPHYISKFVEKAKGSMKGRKGSLYLLRKLPSYFKSIEKCHVLEKKCQGMLELMTHRDYHPGNQKYLGDSVVGVFDFDWCKEELRLFDVAITISYFCTSWKEHEDGVLFFDEIKTLLKAYQERLKCSDRVFPLTSEELDVLPEMVLLANMYVVWWDLREIFDVEESESDEDDCMVYLTHNTKLNEFAIEHLEEIRKIALQFTND